MNDKDIYFNNTSLVNAITENAHGDKKFFVIENGPEGTYITHAELVYSNQNDKINKFDLAVMDAIFTLWYWDKKTITTQMISNVIANKNVGYDKDSSTRLIQIQKSIDKLMNTSIDIECLKVIDELTSQSQVIFLEHGPFIDLTEKTIQSKITHQEKVAYVVNGLILYDYASQLEKILWIPQKFICLEGLGINENDMFITLKREIVKTIQTGKLLNPDAYQFDIEFGNLDISELMYKIGIFKENYATDSQWRKRKSKTLQQIKDLLQALVQTGYLQDFEMIMIRNRVAGAKIVFPHTKIEERLDIVETIITQAYPKKENFIKKTKKALKTVKLCIQALTGRYRDDWSV